jgi:serine/threonine protein phosphatase PrpC
VATSNGRSGVAIEAAGFSDAGRQRPTNEDTIYCQTRNPADAGLYIVCDGVGGHKAGEVASKLAVDTVVGQLTPVVFNGHGIRNGAQSRIQSESLPGFTQAAIEAANDMIRQQAETSPEEAEGMGTTITMAALVDSTAHIGHVGDGRVYLWQDGLLRQITHDHSLAAKLAELGLIDAREVPGHPYGHVLTQALGSREALEVELYELPLGSGDKLLLCSDGFWQAFPDLAELSQWLDDETSAQTLCQQLVEEANRRDGTDNVSAIVITVGGKTSGPGHRS